MNIDNLSDIETDDKAETTLGAVSAPLFSLTPEQNKAFTIFEKGQNLFITGPGGCGKSYVIKYIKNYCELHGRVCAITALTGAAAALINGSTLHSWGGLGLATKSAPELAKKILRIKNFSNRWRQTGVLIIDEVSMMSAELFNKVNSVAKLVRGNTVFFGGLQVVFSGDFAQLAPINADRFCFESQDWEKNIKTVYMSTIIRQTDPVFQRILCELRLGIVTPEARSVFNQKLITDPSTAYTAIEGLDEKVYPTRLYPFKMDVQRINADAFKKLCEKGAERRTYVARDTVYDKHIKVAHEATSDNTKMIDSFCTAEYTLELAVGAQVMLIWNVDMDKGLVNGSRGVVTGFVAAGPVVVFDNGLEVTVGQRKWEIESGSTVLIRNQYPLILAWALTIHKCQGATLTNVITDLTDVFCDGQAYVTLSRVCSLDGLYLLGINYNKIRCADKVKKYYMELGGIFPKK